MGSESTVEYPRRVTSIQLGRLLLRPGDEQQVVLDVAVEPFLLGGQIYTIGEPVKTELAIQRAVTGHVLGLRFATRLAGPCMRCLAPAEEAITVHVREYEADDPDDDHELQSEYVTDGTVDVTSWVRDQIAFAIPHQLLCRPDCAGLCPVCGRDLNADPHTHDGESVDPRWAALEALRGDNA